MFLEVIDFEPDAVYGIDRGLGGAGDLVRVDLTTGNLAYLFGASWPQGVESGGLWFGGGDPNAQTMAPPPINLERWDLRTHETTVWFYRPSAEIYFLGLDRSGAAVVLVINNAALAASASRTSGHGRVPSSEIWLVSQPGTETMIYSAPNADQALDRPLSMIADEHGLWFGSAKGISLYSPGAGTRKVADYSGAPANGCH